jgi:hypothetical protein
MRLNVPARLEGSRFTKVAALSVCNKRLPETTYRLTSTQRLERLACQQDRRNIRNDGESWVVSGSRLLQPHKAATF